MCDSLLDIEVRCLVHFMTKSRSGNDLDRHLLVLAKDPSNWNFYEMVDRVETVYLLKFEWGN